MAAIEGTVTGRGRKISIAENALLQLSGQQPVRVNFNGILSEADLIVSAIALGAENVGRWTQQETVFVSSSIDARISKKQVATLRDLIRSGHDPLGEAFCALRSSEECRENGATYTPGPIVQTMMDWAEKIDNPHRVIDPGIGWERFLMAAGSTFPDAELVGVDIDPLQHC